MTGPVFPSVAHICPEVWLHALLDVCLRLGCPEMSSQDEAVTFDLLGVEEGYCCLHKRWSVEEEVVDDDGKYWSEGLKDLAEMGDLKEQHIKKLKIFLRNAKDYDTCIHNGLDALWLTIMMLSLFTTPSSTICIRNLPRGRVLIRVALLRILQRMTHKNNNK